MVISRWRVVGVVAALLAGVGVVAQPAAAAGAVRQVDVAADGTGTGQPIVVSGRVGYSVSADGRLVAFVAGAPNLVEGDTNGVPDVFVRDVVARTTTLVSVLPGGASNERATGAVISADGRYVAFTAVAAGWPHVWRHDRVTATTELVSAAPGGDPVVAGAEVSSISDDGRFVAFWTSSQDVTPDDTNFATDVFVRDMVEDTTVLASRGPAGAQSRSGSFDGQLSATGRFVAFTGSGFTSGLPHRAEVFRRDLRAGTTVRVSAAVDGGPASANSHMPSISDDGRFVAFLSSAGNLVGGDPINHVQDVFVRDVRAGTTVAAGVGHDGQPANGAEFPWISGNGRFVAFDSHAPNLVPGVTDGQRHVFVRDLVRGTNAIASTAPDGDAGDAPSLAPVLDGAGRTVVFQSSATNLVPGHDEPTAHLYHRRLP